MKSRARRLVSPRFLARAAAVALLLSSASFAALWAAFPFPYDTLERLKRDRSSVLVLDRNGDPLTAFRGNDDCWTFRTPLAEMSPHLVNATLAVEDSRFRLHPGVDPLALARAAFSNLWNMRKVSGASTITMQLIRISSPRPRTMAGKLAESFRALQCDMLYTKDEILELYLNSAPYIGNYYGAESASLLLFGKRSRDLTLSEAALLAGMPQGPSRLRPDRHPEKAERRRNHVLDRMFSLGLISLEDRNRAAAEKLAPASLRTRPFAAPHFCAEAARSAPGKNVVRSTLDPLAQKRAEDCLAERLAQLPGVGCGAAVVIENATGAVRALACLPPYTSAKDAGRINLALSARSPGSALKPFVYALAFEHGIASPSTILSDAPESFNGYLPANYDGEFQNSVSARKALAFSLNIPAVGLLRKAGVERLLALLKNCGISTLGKPASHHGLPLALGAGEVSLLELTNAYATLARDGVHIPFRLAGPDKTTSQEKRVLSAEAAYLTNDILKDNDRLGGIPLWKTGREGIPFAWKTGTSYGNRDAWTVAYTREHTVGVWLGNADGRPDRDLVGISAAAPVAAKIIELTHGEQHLGWHDFDRPEGVIERDICTISGMPAGPYCPKREKEVFGSGIFRAEPCDTHYLALKKVVEKTPDGRALTRHTKEAATKMRDGVSGRVAPDDTTSVRQEGKRASAPPQILSPANGSNYIRLEAGGENQKLQLRASSPSGRIYWIVDGGLFASAKPDENVFWPLRAGPHTIVCADEAGNAAAAEFSVSSR